jgi:putative oxidoreductase
MVLLIALHGLGKFPPTEQLVGWIGGMGFPAPTLFAWLAALTEVVVAGLLLVGLLTRPVGLWLFVYFMIVVLVPHQGDPLRDRELPLIFGGIGLALGLIGPGRFSLDAVLWGRRPASEHATSAD